MDTVWEQLLLVAALILINAAFAGTEMALVTLRDGQIARLAERGQVGRIPDPGDHIEVDGWRFEVIDATDRLINHVRLFSTTGDPPDADEND